MSSHSTIFRLLGQVLFVCYKASHLLYIYCIKCIYVCTKWSEFCYLYIEIFFYIQTNVSRGRKIIFQKVKCKIENPCHNV